MNEKLVGGFDNLIFILFLLFLIFIMVLFVVVVAIFSGFFSICIEVVLGLRLEGFK